MTRAQLADVEPSTTASRRPQVPPTGVCPDRGQAADGPQLIPVLDKVRVIKTPESYLAGLHLRASVSWIKDLTRTGEWGLCTTGAVSARGLR